MQTGILIDPYKESIILVDVENKAHIKDILETNNVKTPLIRDGDILHCIDEFKDDGTELNAFMFNGIIYRGKALLLGKDLEHEHKIASVSSDLDAIKNIVVTPNMAKSKILNFLRKREYKLHEPISFMIDKDRMPYTFTSVQAINDLCKEYRNAFSLYILLFPLENDAVALTNKEFFNVILSLKMQILEHAIAKHSLSNGAKYHKIQ